jgi:uncharacterized protein (TIGR02001 family)
MSDYVFRGITQSNHKPSVAAYFEPRYNITKDIQLYVGVSGESISFTNRAAAEIDLYGGARWTIGPVVLDGGFWYYYYPGGVCMNNAVFCNPAQTPSPNGNFMKADVSFWEVYFKPTWNVNDSLAIGGNLFYTDSFMHSGAPGTYISGTVKYTAPATMAIAKDIGWYVSGEFGRQYLGTTDSFYGLLNTANGPGIDYVDYNTWNVGLGFTWKVFTLDLRYSDTNLSKGDCNAFTGDFTASQTGFITPINAAPGYGSNWCGATFIAKLSADLTLGSLK